MIIMTVFCVVCECLFCVAGKGHTTSKNFLENGPNCQCMWIQIIFLLIHHLPLLVITDTTPKVLFSFQPKFDHNLRNKAGDTPLMTACLNGRLDAVKFLLETAVQNTEEEARDFERQVSYFE